MNYSFNSPATTSPISLLQLKQTHFWQSRRRLQTEPLLSHILLKYKTNFWGKWMVFNLFLLMQELNHRPSTGRFYLHHSGTSGEYFVSVCLLLRCLHINCSATRQKSQTLCDKHLNHRYQTFLDVPPHGYAVVASSTVVVFFFCFLLFRVCAQIFLTVFSWAEQDMFLKVLCVVFSN